MWFQSSLIVLGCLTVTQSGPQMEERWSWGLADEEDKNEIPPKMYQEDDKSWGYVNVTEVTTRLRDIDEDRVCAPFNATVPNYRAPNRRIIQTKCYEYIWLIKFREKSEQKNEDCNRFQLNLPGESKSESGARYVFQGEFPHMAAIGFESKNGSYSFKCGGTLISGKFVMTAAHCSIPSNGTYPRVVRLGHTSSLQHNLNADTQHTIDVKISRILTHPNYTRSSFYNDIALFELEEEVKFSKFIQPACLYHRTDVTKLSKKAKATGWGIYDADQALTIPKLKVAIFDILNDDECNEKWRSICNDMWCKVKNQFCSGDRTGAVDTCKGDSGGPLQVEIPLPTTQGKIHYVIGITSFGSRWCGLKQFPGVYTKVSSFLDWIESLVWPQG